jgi:hypothetical protein
MQLLHIDLTTTRMTDFANVEIDALSLDGDIFGCETEVALHGVTPFLVCVTLVEGLTGNVRFENFLDTLRDLQLQTIGYLKGKTLMSRLINDITITVINKSCNRELKHITLLVG